jgi:hypothetical protein
LQKLTSRFIPATDDSGWLQARTDTVSKFFKGIASQAHSEDPNKQGIYAFTADGHLLGSNNETQNPQVVMMMLREALTKWSAIPEQVRSSKDKTTRMGNSRPLNPEQFYPKDGLILRCTYRDLPREDRHNLADRWNEDFAWFKKQEVFLPNRPRVGQTYEFPANLIRRLARCHLVDMVRGQTEPYKNEEVKTAQLTLRVTKVQASVVSLELEGETRAIADGDWKVDEQGPRHQQRGFEAKLFGYAQYNLRQQRFTSFQLVAIGTRWGGTQYNRRSDDLGRNPTGIVLTLAGTGSSDKISPGLFYAYDW